MAIYKPTSNDNIKKILGYNNCGSLSEINQKDSVCLNLLELDGYINLADFAKNAIELYGEYYLAEFEYSMPSRQYQKKLNELIKSHPNKIDLDASFAGDFAYWIFEKAKDHDTIRSIKLRHKSQVFHYSEKDEYSVESEEYGLGQGRLHNMLSQAQIDASSRNIATYIKDPKYTIFNENMGKLQQAYLSQGQNNEKIQKLNDEIANLQAEILAHKNNNSGLQNDINSKISTIGNIGKKNLNMASIDLSLIGNTPFGTYNDWDGHGFTGTHPSNETIRKMHVQNAEWYKKLNQIQK